jgi:hypothetical protein
LALPYLRFDIAEGQRHGLAAVPPKTVVIDLARRRDVELHFIGLGRGEVELPKNHQRIEGRQFQRRRLVFVEQHHAGFPVEGRRLLPIVARSSARDAEAGRLQTRRRDRADARGAALTMEEQRRESASFRDRRDRVIVARVIEAVHGLPDQET